MQIAEVYLHDGPFPFCKNLKSGINSEIRAKHMISVTCLLENDQKVGIYGSHALRCVAAFFLSKNNISLLSGICESNHPKKG